MKKSLLFFVMLIGCTLESMAQYFIEDPYAFGKGRGLYNTGVYHLINGEYGEAVNAFVEGLEYNPDNYEGLGVCCELGIGDTADREMALDCYKEGAKRGSVKCKGQLARIKRDGFWPATKEYRKRLINSLKIQYGYGNGGASGGGGTFVMPDNSGSGSSSGSTYRTCPSCGGSGNCTGCGGEGKYWVDSGLYTGSGSRTRVNCGSCGGSGRCRVCYGKGRL